MNKKQIKQDKLLKKKVLYQEYWKTIFIQSNRVKDKIKDGDTNTNIVELQSKGETNQNKERLEQGFEKVQLEQKHILKFPKNENPIQESRILQQKTSIKEQNKIQQNKESQISLQPQKDGQIQPASNNVEIYNITQKNTPIDIKGLGKGNHIIDIKKDTNSNFKQKEGKQVLKNVPLLVSSQESLHSNVQNQTKNGIKQQQQQSQQPIIKNIQRIEKPTNDCKQINCQLLPTNDCKQTNSQLLPTNDCKQINSQLLPTKEHNNNINQLEETHQKLLIKESHDIHIDISQTKQQQNIENPKEIDNCMKKQFVEPEKIENVNNDQIQYKTQSSSNIVQQQSISTIDSKNKPIINDSETQEMKLQNEVLNQENINQLSESKDQVNHQIESNTAPTQCVTRNQLKAVHKVMRTLNEKLHQDDMKIQIIWEELLAQQSELIPNFEKFIQCIQFLHNLEKAHFDQQKLTAQLL